MVADNTVTIGLADIIDTASGYEVKSEKSYGLYHNGDYVIIKPGKKAGVGSVKLLVAKRQEEAHHETWPFDMVTDKGTRTYDSYQTVKAGDSLTITNREAYKVVRPGSAAEYDWIGNTDTVVTLVGAYAPDGTDLDITGGKDVDVLTVTWKVFVKDELKSEGVARNKEDAAKAAAALGIKYYRVDVYDEAGNLIWTDNVEPPAGDFPWWIVGAAVAVAVAIVVIWYFYRRSSIPGPAAPAAPAAAPAAAVTVVKV